MCFGSFRVKVRIFRAVSEVQFDKWQLGADYFPVSALCAVSKETAADEVLAHREKGSGWLQKKVSPLWMTAFESVIIDMPLSLILITCCSVWLRVLVTKRLSLWLSSLSVNLAGVRSSSLQRCYNKQSALPCIHLSRLLSNKKLFRTLILLLFLLKS
jgi:hypothetical protein